MGYEVVTQEPSFSSARASAESRVECGVAGHLVTISDANENAFVDSIRGDNRAWIGFYDPIEDGTHGGTYGWVTGETVTYSSWYSGGPTNWPGWGYCVLIGAQSTEHWNNR